MNPELPDWDDMTYEEQRLFLNLPDVQWALTRERLRKSWDELTCFWNAVRSMFRPPDEPKNGNHYGLAGGA